MSDAEVHLAYDSAIATAQAKLYAAREENLATFEAAGQDAVDTIDDATEVYNAAVEAHNAATEMFQRTKYAASLLYRSADKAIVMEYDKAIAAARAIFRSALGGNDEV